MLRHSTRLILVSKKTVPSLVLIWPTNKCLTRLLQKIQWPISRSESRICRKKDWRERRSYRLTSKNVLLSSKKISTRRSPLLKRRGLSRKESLLLSASTRLSSMQKPLVKSARDRKRLPNPLLCPHLSLTLRMRSLRRMTSRIARTMRRIMMTSKTILTKVSKMLSRRVKIR